MLGTIFGAIINFIRRRILASRLNRRVQEIEQNNQNERAVGEYHDSPIEAFVPQNGRGNVVVSGNNDDIRNRIACAMAHNAYEHGRPVIVLHCGNRRLESLFDETFVTESGYYCINSSTNIYDPFDGLPKEEISQLVINSSTRTNKVEYAGGLYIDGLTDFLLARGRRTLISSYIECPHHRIVGRVEEEQNAGNIPYDVGAEILSQLGQGRSGQSSVGQYFYNLNQQAGCILAPGPNPPQTISVKRAIENRNVLILDLISASNELLINVVLQELKNSMADGEDCLVILDSLPVGESQSAGGLLSDFRSCNFVLLSKDVYAETQSSEAQFNTIIARANYLFVMAHNSGDTNRRFSEHFGHYRKLEIVRTYANGDAYARYSQILPGQNVNEILNPQPMDRPRIEEQELSSLGMNEVYIRRDSVHEIAHVNCVYGNATTPYSEPRRRRVQSVTGVRRLNWLLFWLLFIFCFPLAFIYSFIVCNRRGRIISFICLLLICLTFITLTLSQTA